MSDIQSSTASSGGPTSGDKENAQVRWWQSILQTHSLAVIVVFVAIIILSAFLSPVFLTRRNLETLLIVFFVELALVTMAQALVIMVRGIDLSVGGVIALTVICMGFFNKALGFNIWVAMALAVLVGTACGLLNGLVITRLGTPPIITTLGSGIMFQGISLGISGGKPYSGFPESFQWLGQGRLGPFPVQVVILVVIAVFAHLVLSRTRYGRWVYAIGGNPLAARFSGVPVNRVLLVIYTTSGFLTAVAAIIMSARFNSAKSTFGIGSELMSITAALLGGISIAGGEGTVAAALLGMLVIATLESGLTLGKVQITHQLTIIGVLLVLIVLWEQFMKRKRIF